MEAIGVIADLIGIAGAVFALFAWLQARRLRETIERENERRNRKVTVVLQSGGRRVELLWRCAGPNSLAPKSSGASA
ncbi:MAG: hypothetical protein IPK19_25160 [Chloroflexi bacterium]|nr:hypothetical protein [Chloroflexota bacterium]